MGCRQVTFGLNQEFLLIRLLRKSGCGVHTSAELDHRYRIDGLLYRIDRWRFHYRIALQITMRSSIDLYKQNMTLLAAKGHYGCDHVVFLILAGRIALLSQLNTDFGKRLKQLLKRAIRQMEARSVAAICIKIKIKPSHQQFRIFSLSQVNNLISHHS